MTVKTLGQHIETHLASSQNSTRKSARARDSEAHQMDRGARAGARFRRMGLGHGRPHVEILSVAEYRAPMYPTVVQAENAGRHALLIELWHLSRKQAKRPSHGCCGRSPWPPLLQTSTSANLPLAEFDVPPESDWTPGRRYRGYGGRECIVCDPASKTNPSR